MVVGRDVSAAHDRAAIQRESWDIPPIFELLVQMGQLSEREAFHALNMGLGMLIVVPPDAAEAALHALPEVRLVGKSVVGTDVQRL